MRASALVALSISCPYSARSRPVALLASSCAFSSSEPEPQVGSWMVWLALRRCRRR